MAGRGRRGLAPPAPLTALGSWADKASPSPGQGDLRAGWPVWNKAQWPFCGPGARRLGWEEGGGAAVMANATLLAEPQCPGKAGMEAASDTGALRAREQEPKSLGSGRQRAPPPPADGGRTEQG